MSEAQLRVMEPVSEAIVEPGQLAARLDSLDGKRIGLFNNGKLNARELMDEVQRQLAARHGISKFIHGFYNAGRLMRPEEWQGVDDCDAILLTHGD